MEIDFNKQSVLWRWLQTIGGALLVVLFFAVWLFVIFALAV